MVVTHADDGLQLPGLLVERLQSPQTVTIGSEVIGKAVAVSGVGLRPSCPPAAAGSIEGVGVNRDDRVSSCEKPLHNDSIRPFDGDGQISWFSVPPHSGECALEPGFVMVDGESFGHLPLVAEDRDVVALAGPVPSDEHVDSSLVARDNVLLDGAEGRSRRLIGRPLPRLVPNAGLRPSAHRGRLNSFWPSADERNRPYPDGHRRLRPSLIGVAPRMVEQ